LKIGIPAALITSAIDCLAGVGIPPAGNATTPVCCCSSSEKGVVSRVAENVGLSSAAANPFPIRVAIS
jgi:hypothetical protein